MVFGDVSTTKVWANDPRIEVHGPGFSKVIIGEDEADNWEQYIDVIAASIADNSGRSCVNASAVWTPRHAEEIAEALAQKLASIAAASAEDDPEAQLAPFADPNVAGRISAMIDDDLTEPGARETPQRPRPEWSNSRQLHVPAADDRSLRVARSSRSPTASSCSRLRALSSARSRRYPPHRPVTGGDRDHQRSQNFRRELLASPHVGRLNFGPIPTNRISWDQPHEGNLFDHLYARRAFQVA